MRYRHGGWLHPLHANAKINPIWFNRYKESQERRADFIQLTPAQIDHVNRRLLELCPLDKTDLPYIKQEFPGLNPALFGRFYRQHWYSVGETIAHEVGFDVANSHPALSYKTVTLSKGAEEKEIFVPNCYDPGLILPAINELTGLVMGLQIRKDEKRGNNDRYRQISADGKGGTPLTVLKGSPETDLLIITEGLKKAAQARALWECHTISIAGVEAYRETELLPTIEKLGVIRLAIAFDQDKKVKPGVKRAEERLIKIIAAHRPDLKLYSVEWDGDQGKGLDDAIKAGADFRLTPITPKREKRVILDLPLERYLQTFGSPAKALYTVEQAQAKNYELAHRLLTQPEPAHAANTSPTGTGKSTGLDNAAADLVLAQKLTRRTVILVPNKANLKERIKPGTRAYRAIQAGSFDDRVSIQLGRQEAPADSLEKAFECKNTEAKEAGLTRHIPAQVVCKDCPFGSVENWIAKHPEDKDQDGDPRPWKCEQDGFLAAKKRSAQAMLVWATAESYLNGSEDLDQADNIAIDEEVIRHLIEVIELSRENIQTWRERITEKGMSVAPEVEKFFDLLELTLANLPSRYAGVTSTPKSTLFPVMDVLRETAAKLGLMLETFIEAIPAPTETNDTYDFEKYYYSLGKLRLPYRAANDLIEALKHGDLRVQARRREDGSFSFVVHKVREHLVSILREKTLLVLDATVPPTLKALFPDIVEYCFDVPQSKVITQTTNAIYTARDLHNDTTRAQVEQAISKFCEGAESALAIVPKSFEEGERAPKLNLPPGVQVQHWGLHRASNQYSKVERLAMVGHYMRPVDYIRAELDCLRAYGYLPAAEPNDQAEGEELRLYNFVKDGKAAGRYCKANADPYLQAAIQHDYTANIIQAIGRLRAALRPDDQPAQILILCAEPVNGLQIDRLMTTRQLLALDQLTEVEQPEGITPLELNHHAPHFNVLSLGYTCENPKKQGHGLQEEIYPVITSQPEAAAPPAVEIGMAETPPSADLKATVITEVTVIDQPTVIVTSIYSGYLVMLERQEWLEGVADVERRIEAASLLSDKERTKLLTYAKHRRATLKPPKERVKDALKCS
jgi:hypothetical protein